MTSVADVREAQRTLQGLDLPGNWLLADAAGNIAYQQTGLSPVRAAAYSGLHVGLRWRHDWVLGNHPRHLMLSHFNPPEGYLWSANNEFNTPQQRVVTFHLERLPGRAARVERLIKRALRASHSRRLSRASVRELAEQLAQDTFSQSAFRWMKIIRPHARGTPLEHFDCFFNGTAASALATSHFALVVDELRLQAMGHVFGPRMWLDHLQRIPMTEAYWDAVLLEHRDSAPFLPAWDVPAALRAVAERGQVSAAPRRTPWYHMLLGGVLPPLLSPFDRGPMVVRGCPGTCASTFKLTADEAGSRLPTRFASRDRAQRSRDADCRLLECAHGSRRPRLHRDLLARRRSVR